jgi:hypothetical protein
VGALVVTRAPVFAAAALGALLVLPACGALSFHSRISHTAHDPDLDVSVDDVVVAKMVQPEFEEHFGLRLVATMTARPGAAWGAPRMNTARRRPCEGGWAATGDATFSPPTGQPTQQTTLTFAGPPAARAALFAEGSATLDVPVFPADPAAAHRCLRVPLQTLRAGTEWQARPWMVGLDLRLVFLARPLHGYESDALLIGFPQGFWIDRWRFTVGFQGGLVSERGVAPTNPPPATRPSVGILGADLRVDRMLLASRHLGLDAQLGYDLLFTVAPNAQTSAAAAAAYQGALLHGPRVALRFLILASARPEWPGFAAPPDSTGFGLSAFAGAWWQSSGGSAPAPIFGFSLDGNLSL